MDIYPEPGSLIPIEDYHLLNDAFVEFQPGEYVGYQLEDPSLQLEEKVASYIYAIIIEKVMDEDGILELLKKKYIINIGNDKEPVMVNAVNLHKFCPLQNIPECPQNRNRRVVFGEISDVLEDAWTLPEKQKLQIVKRLVLQWHPEKKVRDEEFCSEAFEHIKNEISCLGLEVTSGAVNVLMQRISSPQFVRAIVRIMRDANSQREDFDEQVIENMEKVLQSIELCAVKSLKTALFYNEGFIPGSETEVRSFIEKHGVAGEETYRVYVNVGTGIDGGALARSVVSNVIVEIYGELLGKNAYLIPEMLLCPLGDIWSLLDRTGIRQDDTYKAEEMDIFPEPGTSIPIEDHHLLNDAFVEFQPGEYVGYQLEDPSLQLEEGVATYIYAIIIEKAMDEDGILELLAKKYIINIGHDKEPVMVNAANLHKFCLLQEISECSQDRNRRVVFGEISDVLEDAWTLPEKQKLQIIKRLVLQWHPEKKVRDEEFCSDAFEHIKNEISCLGLEVTSGAVNVLMQRISSPQFVRAIVRIMRDANSQREDFDEQAIENMEKVLQSIELCAVKSLKTALFYNEGFIPGSETEVRSFIEKHGVAGEETYRVYVNVGTGIDGGALARSVVSNVIVEIYGELLGKNAYLIPEMLLCPLGDIWPLLDKTGIRQDDIYKTAEMDIYPEPGSFIPIEFHHLLTDAFVEFQPGEYVGYQLEDPSVQLEEGVATYIYAIIIENVMDENGILEILNKKYLINIGNDKEPVMVNAVNLHKFCRLHEISECPQNRNRRVVFGEISDVLEDAWTLPEKQKLQTVKRLVLKWHPEKNVGDEEFCSEAFEHMKNEISRLGGSYLFKDSDVTIARAKEHGSHREEYRERFVRQYGPWKGRKSWQNYPPSFSKRNPQPGEARRWFRQAEADLAAGANEIDSSRPSYEWACFKCHQAAEKALKAAQYTIDVDKTRVHNLVENSIGLRHVLSDSKLTNLARKLETLVGGSARMRYPDQVSWPKIPNEVYSARMAEQALQLSEKIVVRVKPRIN
ncbi:hypothetical protein ACROYT_G024990 [Oculina patagonica]